MRANHSERRFLAGPASRLAELRARAAHLRRAPARLSRAPLPRALRHGLRLRPVRRGRSLLHARARDGSPHRPHGLHRDDRRRPRHHGGGQPRRPRRRRLLDRLQHRAAAGAEAEPVPGSLHRVQALLRAQADAREVLVRLRRATRRLRHARRDLRGRDADPNAQDRELPLRADGPRVLGAAARVHHAST